VGLKSRITSIFVIIFALICSVAYIAFLYHAPETNPNVEQVAIVDSDISKQHPLRSINSYEGEVTRISRSFSIKTPNGWTASISNNSNFLAIMFARPNQLESLTYKSDVSPSIDQRGIPAWNGLTEHFFIIEPIASRQFNSADHLEVSSEPFVFNDGVVGKKYLVIKDSVEAQKWGGLQKDAEWEGRTYVYEKDGEHIEAHLAMYSSSTNDINFYEHIIRTLQAPLP